MIPVFIDSIEGPKKVVYGPTDQVSRQWFWEVTWRQTPDDWARVVRSFDTREEARRFTRALHGGYLPR